MNPMQILSMLPSLKQNPAAFLQSMGIQLPPNTTDPNAILDYLVRICSSKTIREKSPMPGLFFFTKGITFHSHLFFGFVLQIII